MTTRITRNTINTDLILKASVLAGIQSAKSERAVGGDNRETAEKEVQDSGRPCWTNSLGMKFIRVPGTRVMFSIWLTRVADYEDYRVASSGVAVQGRRPPAGGQGKRPVQGLNREEARAFCDWLTLKEREEGRIGMLQLYRLPTDAEWSTAAGEQDEAGPTPAEKDRGSWDAYCWGREWPPAEGMTYSGDWPQGKDRWTSPGVGDSKANMFGLYEMDGMVWQWCEDSYYGDGVEGVVRGPSFFCLSESGSVASWRLPFDPELRWFGFRCVLDVGAQ